MAFPSLDEMKAITQTFCQRSAHMITLDKSGLPTGRTLGARMNPDFTVDIGTMKPFKRLQQVKRNPALMFIWSEQPAQGVMKVIYAKGHGEVITGEAVRDWYANLIATQGPRGTMTPDQAAEELEVIRFHPTEFRAEGFAAEGTELSRDEVRTGMTWKV